MQFAGAYNPLYIIRKEELTIKNKVIDSQIPKTPNSLTILEPDRQPIAIFIKEIPFTNHELQLQQNDALYFFSDGYSDQFGGDKDNKFNLKQFRKLLLKVQDKTMPEQEQILETTFENWRGNNKQLDDVLIVGVKI